ncbi:hypothetical protein NBO_70g0004, partial [Nosema bombycis CQ1]
MDIARLSTLLSLGCELNMLFGLEQEGINVSFVDLFIPALATQFGGGLIANLVYKNSTLTPECMSLFLIGLLLFSVIHKITVIKQIVKICPIIGKSLSFVGLKNSKTPFYLIVGSLLAGEVAGKLINKLLLNKQKIENTPEDLTHLDKKTSMRLVEINKPQGKTVSMYTLDDIALPSVRNLSREILYEGFVSLDSILFLLETQILTSAELTNFLNETVLTAKKISLEDPYVFEYFTNFSTKVDCKDKKIKNLIEKRNKIFEKDKSQIALILTKNKIESFKKRITTNLLLYDDKKDDEYIRMVQDLANSRYGDDGVSVNLAKERFEFYRESVNLSQTQIDEAKISLNLGGSIFSPSLLAVMTKKITIADKRDVIKES